MHVVRVIFQVKPSCLEQLEEHIRSEVPKVEALPGSRVYMFCQASTDRSRWLLYEEWEDVAAFERYKQSELFAQATQALFPMMEGRPSSAYYQAEQVGP